MGYLVTYEIPYEGAFIERFDSLESAKAFIQGALRNPDYRLDDFSIYEAKGIDVFSLGL